MEKSLWLALGISVYNWFAFISNQVTWKRNPDAFGTPTIPFIGSIFLALIIWGYLEQNTFTIFKIILCSLIFIGELIFTLPFFFFIIQETYKNWRAIKVYPNQGEKTKKHDFDKNGAEISMIGDFLCVSENNKTWFELNNYKDKPTLRFPVLWSIPEVSTIKEATVRFAEVSSIKDDFIEVPAENIYQIKVWTK